MNLKDDVPFSSNDISFILSTMRSMSEYYRIFYDEVGEEEKLLCDLEHKLELEELKYHQIAQLGKDIRASRKKRRIAKDNVALLEPVVIWISENESAIKSLEHVLGKMRKIEETQRNRIYIPRLNFEHKEIRGTRGS